MFLFESGQNFSRKSCFLGCLIEHQVVFGKRDVCENLAEVILGLDAGLFSQKIHRVLANSPSDLAVCEAFGCSVFARGGSRSYYSRPRTCTSDTCSVFCSATCSAEDRVFGQSLTVDPLTFSEIFFFWFCFEKY